MENIVKKIIRIAQNKSLPYHDGHAYKASQFLKAVESERGALSSQLVSECNDYATDVLGGKKYAPWLYVYSAIAGQFKQGWIPINFYGSQVIPNIKGHYGDCSFLKPLNKAFLNAPELPDLGSFVNGLFLDRFYTVVSPKYFRYFLFSDNDRVIFKTDNSNQGQGIYIFDSKTFNIEKLKTLGNGVFQKYVDQHSSFGEYTPKSVATIRITTAINDLGEVSARGAYFRLGTGKDTHVKSDTSLSIPIDLLLGTLSDTGYTPSWTTTRSHPTSHKIFSGFQIPAFKNCIDVVTSLHLKVPFVRCIGWDVTVNSDGKVVVLEWNGAHNSIRLTEATQGPCFADLGWEKFR